MIKNPLYKYGEGSFPIPSHINLGRFLLDKMSEYKDVDAVTNATTGQKITYKDIVQQSMNLAVSLYSIGVRKGHTVAFCSENREELCPTIVGILCTGATLTAINFGYSKGELKHVLGISKPDYIFCSPTTYKMFEKTFQSLPHVKKVFVYGNVVNRNVINYEQLVKNNVSYQDFQVVEVDGQADVAVVLYSSGTTGLPKGVLLTHYNVITTCSQASDGADQFQMPPPIKSLTIAPWFHAMGLMGMLTSLSNGRSMFYLPKFDVDSFLKTIEKYKVVVCGIVPPVLVAITKTKLNYDLSSLLMIFCGAAPLAKEVIETAMTMFPNLRGITQGYGMTEATLAITKDFGAYPDKSMRGTVGFAVPGTIIKIVDLETNKTLGPNQRGELCVKGVCITKGYIGKDRKHDFDDEGFLKTGDVAYYDEDGYFYIVDRLKELIKYKGFQVPPAEIESVLLSHPSVRDAGVVGVPRREGGEVPVAFVALQPGATASEEEIKHFVKERLSNPKHLRGGVRFIENIPKNPSGKILRRELKKLATEQKSKL